MLIKHDHSLEGVWCKITRQHWTTWQINQAVVASHTGGPDLRSNGHTDSVPVWNYPCCQVASRHSYSGVLGKGVNRRTSLCNLPANCLMAHLAWPFGEGQCSSCKGFLSVACKALHHHKRNTQPVIPIFARLHSVDPYIEHLYIHRALIPGVRQVFITT